MRYGYNCVSITRRQGNACKVSLHRKHDCDTRRQNCFTKADSGVMNELLSGLLDLT